MKYAKIRAKIAQRSGYNVRKKVLVDRKMLPSKNLTSISCLSQKVQIILEWKPDFGISKIYDLEECSLKFKIHFDIVNSSIG